MVIAVVAAFALSASAGSNPDCQVCIDFSGTATSWDEVQSRVDPEQYTMFVAYFCIYGINAFTNISLMGYVTPGISTPAAFTCLLPNPIVIGTWDTGITMATGQCLTDRFLYVAKLELFYLGTPGDIMILDHPQWPRWVVDCVDPEPELDFYCVWMHGGVWKDALEGDEECFPVVPVEDATWGTIKSMYR
jgi:hypothetical protein